MDPGFGGAGSSVAIGLARLGVPVTWNGRFGNDALGGLFERELRAEGVHSAATHGECGLFHGVAVGKSVCALGSELHNVHDVDTVGGGDAFVAGYLAELLAGASLSGRLRTAAACGAVACTAPGDWEAAPDRAAIARLLGAGDPVQR